MGPNQAMGMGHGVGPWGGHVTRGLWRESLQKISNNGRIAKSLLHFNDLTFQNIEIIDIFDIIWSSKWLRPTISRFNMDDRMFKQMHAPCLKDDTIARTSIWALMDLSKSYICICKTKKSYHSMLGLEITLIRKLEHEKERIFVSCTLFATSLDLSNGVFAQALQKLLPFDWLQKLFPEIYSSVAIGMFFFIFPTN